MTDREGTNEPGGADEVAAARDALGELSDTESLRLQMAMDRRSKAGSALSNLLKKQGEVNQSITDNLK